MKSHREWGITLQEDRSAGRVSSFPAVLTLAALKVMVDSITGIIFLCGSEVEGESISLQQALTLKWSIGLAGGSLSVTTAFRYKKSCIIT